MASAAPAPDEGRGTDHVIGLDLVRFLAALLVMAYHLGFACWAGDGLVARIAGGSVRYEGLAPFSWFGWIGVEIFFTLSAIVICLSAERSSARSFAIARFVRLYPAAWICATISAAALALSGQSGLVERMARSLVLAPMGPWVDDVYWTLAFEMAFYAFVFLLLLLGAIRRLPLLLGLIGLASSALWSLWWADRLWELGPVADAFIVIGTAAPMRFFIGFGCFFAAGGFLYLGIRKGWTAGRAALLALCCAGSLLRIAFRSSLLGEEMGWRFDPLFPAAIWAAAVLLMAVALAWNEAALRRFGRHSAGFRAIGLATYPLYLLHAAAGTALIVGLRSAGLAQGAALAAAAAIVISASFAVALWLERPLQRRLKAGLGRAFPIAARRV